MYTPTTKMLWGLAKCKELALTDEELHEIVYSQTGKDSIKNLTIRELRQVIVVLGNLKEMAAGSKNRGNNVTKEQRKKIKVLTDKLGWKDSKRVNGMCRRMFKVSCLEWLDYKQCSKLIEALKAMEKRERGRDGEKTEDK